MNKIQKIIKFIKSDKGLFSVTLAIILLMFIVLNPKISNQLFIFKREVFLNNFINSVKSRGAIDAKKYWEFREFYSPGFFNFSKTGIDVRLFNDTKEAIDLKFNEKASPEAFLIYSSPKLNSIDMLTANKDLNTMYVLPRTVNVLFVNKNSIIYKSDSKTIKIIFLLNNKDMQSANGFFDYKDKDKKITEGKNWFNVTSLTIE